MTMNISYHDELVNEFIKNEESWITRSANINELKKAQKIKEREEERHKKNVSFFMMVAFVLVLATVILGALGYTISLMIPKTISDIESRYEVSYYTYTVRDGETLNNIREDILRTHKSITDKINRWNYGELIEELNDLEDPNMIYPGDEIIYPVF